ncbi:MFS transporter [Mycobacterium sp. DL592]|uniref:MFS transporter n=1 Tax=Mycobacterium sp. DL592 TaxID=2675524 RepID=UPI001420E6F0|nr:MFS transporter [Mycobacterium sp. DL592]
MRCSVPRRYGARWFLPLIAAAGVTVSLTAPLEVLFIQERSDNSAYTAVFMLTAGIGVIAVDVFGTRFVPGIDARTALTAGLALFGLACIGMGVDGGGLMLMCSRILQGLGSGVMLGAGLQAAVRVSSAPESASAAGQPSLDIARSLARFNAAFLLGGALGSPGGLLVAGLLDGHAGYRVAFVSTGLLALLVAAACAVVLPNLAAPPGTAPPSLGLPRFARSPGSAAALVLAMLGDFLRGGVLFTALPLAGAVRNYPTTTIAVAIALMSGAEILALQVAYRVIRRFGMVAVLVSSFITGTCCAGMLALASGTATYLIASALFGIGLAGATASLPVLVVTQVGDSTSGLAKFRISAGIGILVGSAGSAVLANGIGIAWLFALIAIILLGSSYLAHAVGRRMTPA